MAKKASMQTVAINGVYKGTSLTHPKQIIKLFRPVTFCNPKMQVGGRPVYSLVAWTDYLNDIDRTLIGSLSFIAIQDDLQFHKGRINPFLFVARGLSGKEAQIVKGSEVGKQIKLPCRCHFEEVPLTEYPTDLTPDIIISGHNVDER